MSEVKKTCKKCGTSKPITEFYKQKSTADGHLNQCKECVVRRVAKYREKNIQKIKEYDRERANLPHRVEARKKYSQTESGKKRIAEAKERWLKRNPVARAAHVILGNSIKSGLIKKEPCEVCGSTIKIHAHHEDYSRPLEVRWLCPTHHSSLHKSRRRS